MQSVLICPDRHKFFIVLALIAFLFNPLSADARVLHHKAAHHKPVHHGVPVDGSASYSDIVIDAESGRIVHATSPDSVRHPASLTKMMTLYVTFQALETGRLRLDQRLPVSINAAEQSPSKLGLRKGQSVRVQDLILGLVTESANDAAVVIAESLGGSEAGFGILMTQQARALGMTHTRFDNPSGLPDPDQVTTARDMAMLGHALIFHYPQFYPYFSHDNFVYAGINHHNHNHLMSRYDGMDGIKTGYIRASGFNLVASARRGQTRLIGVVFGGHSAISRDNHMAQLLDDAFAQVRQEKAISRMASETNSGTLGQGDTDDAVMREGDEYVTLPAKVSAVFVPASGRAPDPTWGIQIGAFSDPELGRRSIARAVEQMPEILGKADPEVQPVRSDGVTTYRARLLGFDQKAARSACSALLEHGQSCMLVEP